MFKQTVKLKYLENFMPEKFPALKYIFNVNQMFFFGLFYLSSFIKSFIINYKALLVPCIFYKIVYDVSLVNDKENFFNSIIKPFL